MQVRRLQSILSVSCNTEVKSFGGSTYQMRENSQLKLGWLGQSWRHTNKKLNYSLLPHSELLFPEIKNIDIRLHTIFLPSWRWWNAKLMVYIHLSSVFDFPTKWHMSNQLVLPYIGLPWKHRVVLKTNTCNALINNIGCTSSQWRPYFSWIMWIIF